MSEKAYGYCERFRFDAHHLDNEEEEYKKNRVIGRIRGNIQSATIFDL